MSASENQKKNTFSLTVKEASYCLAALVHYADGFSPSFRDAYLEKTRQNIGELIKDDMNLPDEEGFGSITNRTTVASCTLARHYNSDTQQQCLGTALTAMKNAACSSAFRKTFLANQDGFFLSDETAKKFHAKRKETIDRVAITSNAHHLADILPSTVAGAFGLPKKDKNLELIEKETLALFAENDPFMPSLRDETIPDLDAYIKRTKAAFGAVTALHGTLRVA